MVAVFGGYTPFALLLYAAQGVVDLAHEFSTRGAVGVGSETRAAGRMLSAVCE